MDIIVFSNFNVNVLFLLKRCLYYEYTEINEIAIGLENYAIIYNFEIEHIKEYLDAHILIWFN